MKKLTTIVFALLLCGSWLPAYAAQQPLAGDWIGQIDFGKEWQRINFHFTVEKEGLKGTLDLTDQGRIGLPLKSIVVESAHLRIEWQGRSGLATYNGEI